MADLTDEELLLRYRASENTADGDALIDQLFQRHHRRVAAWCYRLTGDIETSADFAQEIFLKAFQRLGSFRGDSRFTTWLYTIARNHCLDQLRLRSASLQQLSEELPDQLADFRAEAISSIVERRESEELLRKLMRETLDDVEAKVMTLHYVHEMPLDAVARALRLTNPSGAKAYVVAARRKLTKAMANWKGRTAARGENNAG